MMVEILLDAIFFALFFWLGWFLHKLMKGEKEE